MTDNHKHYFITYTFTKKCITCGVIKYETVGKAV